MLCTVTKKLMRPPDGEVDDDQYPAVAVNATSFRRLRSVSQSCPRSAVATANGSPTNRVSEPAIAARCRSDTADQRSWSRSPAVGALPMRSMSLSPSVRGDPA